MVGVGREGCWEGGQASASVSCEEKLFSTVAQTRLSYVKL